MSITHYMLYVTQPLKYRPREEAKIRYSEDAHLGTLPSGLRSPTNGQQGYAWRWEALAAAYHVMQSKQDQAGRRARLVIGTDASCKPVVDLTKGPCRRGTLSGPESEVRRRKELQ